MLDLRHPVYAQAEYKVSVVVAGRGHLLRKYHAESDDVDAVYGYYVT